MVAPIISMAVVEQLPIAVTVAGRDGQILHTNRASGEMLVHSGPLTVQDGYLCGPTSSETERLRALINRLIDAARADAPGDRGEFTEEVLVLDGETPDVRVLKLAGVPPHWCPQGWTGEANQPVCLVLAETGTTPSVADESFRRTYGLGPAETQIVRRLSEGLSPEEIAEERGSRLNTVRSQIRQIKDKTGVTKTSALIALFHRFDRFWLDFRAGAG
jgi:DNA-binding CsgD family transcriptional regulator